MNKLKHIIGNGLPYGILFFVLSFVIGNYWVYLPLSKTLLISSIIGAAALLINGMLYSRFTKPLKELDRISIQLSHPETLLLQAPANFLVEDGLIPGKLFLTEQRMIFKSYPVDDETAKEYSWNKAHLKADKFYGSIRNAGGQFRLKLEQDTSLMFEVNYLRDWRNAFFE